MKKQLWDAVLNDPTSIERRLIYADALSAEGDPRGEFISLQCRRFRGNALKDAKAREAELLDAHREEWFGPLEKWLRERDSYALGHVKVERGFVTEAKLWVRDEDDVETLFNKAPLLESLKLFGEETPKLAPLQRLLRLEVASDVSDSVLEYISDGARFDRLTHLELVGITGMVALRLAHLTSLQSLKCDAQVKLVTFPPSLESLTWDGGDHLLMTALKPLRRLAISKLQVDAHVLRSLQALAPQLERLVLDWAKFDAGLLVEFLKTPWPKLKALDLSSVSLGAELASLDAPVLETLDVSNARMKDDAVAKLLASPLLDSLKEISLRANKVTAAAIAPLSKRKHQLRLLNLKKTAVTPAELKQLAKAFPDTKLSR